MIKKLKELIYNIKHMNILKADVSIAEKNIDFWNRMYNKEHEKRVKAEFNLSEEKKYSESIENILSLICDRYSISRVYLDKESLEKSKNKFDFTYKNDSGYDIMLVDLKKEKEVIDND